MGSGCWRRLRRDHYMPGVIRQTAGLFTLGFDMFDNDDKIRVLRQQIPSFACVPGCHDCCGPVTTSTTEMARLPRKTRAEQEAALAELNCVHLGPHGCTVYGERPLICRLFGTTPKLACPRGCAPQAMIEPDVEAQIHTYIATTRQVLV